MTCIIVDDEPFAIEILADDLQKIPFLEIKGCFSNAQEAQKRLAEGGVDLIFLDIQMPILRGTDFLRSLETPPMTIFTTAYEQYALEGFELNVVDYLVKPIVFQRLQQAAQRAFDLYQLQKRELPQERTFFFIFSEYQKIKLFHDDILYIEGMKDYVKIFTKTQSKPILTRSNLKNITSKLPEKRFCRIHQSFIVALDKITSFQKSKLYVGKQELPIGEKFLRTFEEIWVEK